MVYINIDGKSYERALYGPIGHAEPLFASRGNNLYEAFLAQQTDVSLVALQKHQGRSTPSLPIRQRARLAWTEHIPTFTPIELRKRQLFDMTQFFGVPEDLQNHVKTLTREWGKPEDFDNSLPMIRALLEGKSVNAAELEGRMSGYQMHARA